MEQNRCPGCMEIKSGGAVCGHCGFDPRKQNAPHQLQTGTLLQERYLVGRTLGQGGFGITYLGWNRYLERKVAIKEYYPSVFVDRNTAYHTGVSCRTEQMEAFFAENRMRFLREAKTLAKLEQVPQIVSILDFFEANNTAYIVMEYLRGDDLRSYLRKKGGRMTPEETFRILRPVMAALVQVHEAGLVHRDISPDNIMLQYDGSVKLMDFGAVRSVEHPGVEKELTEATQAIVKHGFAPIEQYSAKGSIGPWTDEYALCATMYYCMTGKVPENVHDRIMGTDLVWDGIEGLTAQQKKILQKGMAIHAKDRYPSIRELMDALFPRFNQPAAGQETAKQPARKRRKGIVAAAAIVCAAAALAVMLGASPADKGEPVVPATELQITEPPATEPPVTNPLKRPLRIERRRATISTGGGHTVGLKTNGTVVAVGSNGSGQCNVSGWSNIIGVSAGGNHTVAVKADGTVVATGYNRDGQCDVSGWTDIVAVSAGYNHTVGLKKDGTVVAAGKKDYGQCNVSGWTDIVIISAGYGYTVGLKSDGTVVSAGTNAYGQRNVADWTDIVAVSAKDADTVGLKSDGTVVVTGSNVHDWCDVSDWTDIVTVSVGYDHVLGLKEDGTVVAVGWNRKGQCEVSGWRDIVAISVGAYHSVGLKEDGTVVAVGDNDYGQCDVFEWKNIRLP